MYIVFSYFLRYNRTIVLIIGVLTMLMSVYLDNKRRIKLLSPEPDHPILRMLGLYAISVGQALLVGVIVQFLFFHLDDLGKILSMILLVLQLTSTGGTFPVEMTPPFFQFIHRFVPMTYGIQLQKEAISGSSASYLWHNTWILLVFFGVFTAATLALDYVKLYRRKKRGDLPSGTLQPLGS
ncbi:MAG: hypothetical protein PUC32_04735 [Oscillospiraceae bacterium]|nr:hypothetical protein [Oscillospiraceae bacterium]